MKKVISIIFLIGLISLSACGNNSDENTQKQTSEQPKPTETVETTGEDNMETQNADTSAQVDPKPMDLVEIMNKSLEEMENMTSVKVVGEIVSDQTNRYQNSVLTWNVELDMNLIGKIVMHEFITIEDGRTDTTNMELYTTPETFYVRNEDDTWTSTPAFVGGYQHISLMSPEKMRRFITYEDKFQVHDEGDFYKLSYEGSGDDFKALVYGVSSEMVDDILKETFNEMEISGSFEMTIDKESFFVTSYTMNHDAVATTQETGDYHVIEKQEYTLSNFNEYDDLNIPEEVLQQAVPQ